MYNQVIVGKPKKCINRNCKQKFFKESFLGFLPLSVSEVLCIMKCPKCSDVFAIVQSVSIIKGYLSELPTTPVRNVSNVPLITTDEIENIKKTLKEKNALLMLDDDTVL